MSEKTYNGWKNYETWAVKLWMDNEESTYRHWRDESRRLARKALDRDEFLASLADALKDAHNDEAPELDGVWADLLGAALSEVDWHEVAESFVEDVQECWQTEEDETEDA